MFVFSSLKDFFFVSKFLARFEHSLALPVCGTNLSSTDVAYTHNNILCINYNIIIYNYYICLCEGGCTLCVCAYVNNVLIQQ